MSKTTSTTPMPTTQKYETINRSMESSKIATNPEVTIKSKNLAILHDLRKKWAFYRGFGYVENEPKTISATTTTPMRILNALEIEQGTVPSNKKDLNNGFVYVCE